MFSLKGFQDGSSVVKMIGNSHYLIDEAWDLFSEYIGEHKLETPLELDQFEIIFDEINENGKFNNMKAEILNSFRYDSYSWPMVKK